MTGVAIRGAGIMPFRKQVPLSLAEMAAIGVHTVAMFLVMGAVAIIVFEKVGLAILRRAWFNLDRAWAEALVAAGALSLVL